MEILSDFFFKIFLFLKFKSFPILLNIVFLSYWIPLLFFFFVKKERHFLWLSLAFLILFIKEIMLFFSLDLIFPSLSSNAEITVSNYEWVILETFFFYIFFLILLKIFRDSTKVKNFFYPAIEPKNIFLTWLRIPMFILVMVITFLFSPASFLSPLFIIFSIIALLIYILRIYKDYSHFSHVLLNKEVITSIRIFLSISAFIFTTFFYYFTLLILNQEGGNTFIDLTRVETFLERFIPPAKSLNYFFLCFFASALVKHSFFMQKNIKKTKDLSESVINSFFSNLNEDKITLSQPIALLKKSLFWIKEKLNADYVIFHFPEFLLSPIIITSEEKENKVEKKIIDFPYFKEVLTDPTYMNNDFFFTNLVSKGEVVRDEFSHFLGSEYGFTEDYKENFVPANSLISLRFQVPFLDNKRGNIILINNRKTYWHEDHEVIILKKFVDYLKGFLVHLVTYKKNYLKRSEIINEKVDKEFIKEIHILEKKYMKQGLDKNSKFLDVRSFTLFPDSYPNNSFLIKEKEEEVFVLSNYFQEAINKNTMVMNSLALLNGLGEEFVNSKKAEKSPAMFLRKTNNFLCNFKQEENFISSFVFSYNVKSKKLHFSNALHRPLLVYKTAEKEFWLQDINERGLPLGLKKGEEYKDDSLTLNLGDILIFLPESLSKKNVNGEEYNFDLLYKLIRENLSTSFDSLIEIIKSSIENFYVADSPNRIVVLFIKVVA